jgi:hypothetical protein
MIRSMGHKFRAVLSGRGDVSLERYMARVMLSMGLIEPVRRTADTVSFRRVPKHVRNRRAKRKAQRRARRITRLHGG